jgi:hypothetical protein
MMKITHLPNGGTLYEYSDDNICFLAEWFLNGKLHREDGPAIEYGDGQKSWYLNDKLLSQEQFLQLLRLKAFW